MIKPLPPPRKLPHKNNDKHSRVDIVDEEVEDVSDIFHVTKSNIGFFSFHEMRNISTCIVNTLNPTVDQLRGITSHHGTLDDPLMGPVKPGVPCMSCKEQNCVGHYGLIEFDAFIINPACIREIISVLSSVCKHCSKLLLLPKYLKDKGILSMGKKQRLAQIAEKSMGATCLRSDDSLEETTGVKGRKMGKIRACGKNPVYEKSKDIDKKTGIIKYKDTDKEGKTVTVPMLNLDIYNILNNISEEDYEILGFDKSSPPVNMIMQGILVMPRMMRPTSFQGTKIGEDNFTYHYKNILTATLRKDKIDKKDNREQNIYKAVYALYYGNKDLSSYSVKELRSLTQKIQSKAGIIRNAQMGKNIDACGRTVGGPASNIEFDAVRIPKTWSKTLLTSIKVSNTNIDYIRELIKEEKVTHFTKKGKTSKIIFQRAGKDYKLEVGDIVERELQNDDIIIVNRQPSLHKTSMMARRTVLGNELTVGIHLSHTTPMNADFDGDELNVHKPRSLIVEAESLFILNVMNNIISGENNSPTMGFVMNSITGAYLLSKTTKLIDQSFLNDLLNNLTNKDNLKTLEYRLKRYNINPYSGKALLSVLFPEDFNYFYNDKPYILEGVLISSSLNKDQVGVNHRSIIQELYKQYGEESVKNFLTDGPIIINKWLEETGFSVGYDDCIDIEVDENGNEYNANQRQVDIKMKEIDNKLWEINQDITSDDPYEKMLKESRISDLVNFNKTLGAEIAKKQLSKNNNSIGVMTEEGAKSKGSNANVISMFGSVGQQFLKGKRLNFYLTNNTRTLAYFDPNSSDIKARGFVESSYLKGLSAEEFFFIHTSGRENLIDTALKTQDTGTNQRHMMKSFENGISGNDNSLRNIFGRHYNPIHNSGYNVNKMIKTINKESREEIVSFIDIVSVVKTLNIKRGWSPKEVLKLVSGATSAVGAAASTDVADESPFGVKSKKYKPKIVDSDLMMEENNKIKINNKQRKITLFEKTTLIGSRATQLSNNAKPLIDTEGESDYMKIAIMEYEAGVIPIYVIRKYTNGMTEKIYPTIDNIKSF